MHLTSVYNLHFLITSSRLTPQKEYVLITSHISLVLILSQGKQKTTWF